MSLLKFFSVALAVMLYFNCNSSSNSGSLPASNDGGTGDSQTEKIPDDLLMTLERTVCFGVCPNYKLTVKADGSVLFEGITHTETKGTAEGKISEEKVRQLLKEFKEADYFNLTGDYDCYQVTDNPSAVTSIQINGKNKSIRHYYGCEQGSDEFKKELAKLKQLESKIDEIVETKRWIGERK